MRHKSMQYVHLSKCKTTLSELHTVLMTKVQEVNNTDQICTKMSLIQSILYEMFHIIIDITTITDMFHTNHNKSPVYHQIIILPIVNRLCQYVLVMCVNMYHHLDPRLLPKNHKHRSRHKHHRIVHQQIQTYQHYCVILSYHLTAATCPCSTVVHAPLSTSQTLSVASRDPLTTVIR